MVHVYMTSAGGSVSFTTDYTGGCHFQDIMFLAMEKAGSSFDGGLVVSSDEIPLFEERCEDKRGKLDEAATCELVAEWFNLDLGG